MRRWFVALVAGCGAAFACSSFGGSDAPPTSPTDDGGLDAAVDAADAAATAPPDAAVDASCTITSLAVGCVGRHTCAVKGDGSVWCWGSNTNGQLGLGAGAPPFVALPMRVPGLDHVVEVAAGGDFTCARTADASVYCWGRNNAGQLGLGSTADQSSPRKLPSLGPVKSLRAGGFHACAITNDDLSWCWGFNVYGEVGVTPATASEPFPKRTLLDQPVRSIAPGAYHTCAVALNGALLCWGLNEFAELVGPVDAGPDGSPDLAAHPSPLLVFDGGVSEVATGNATTCAAVGGQPFCWGFAGAGEVGAGGLPITYDRPTAVVVPAGVVLDRLAVGTNQTCALRGDAGPWCWGDNSLGQSGPTAAMRQPVPTFVGAMAALSVHPGIDHTCARVAEGPPQCWGSTGLGELGRGFADDGGIAHADPAPVKALCP